MARTLVMLLCLAACGDNITIPGPASIPQVHSGGGPVLASPEVVPIFFPNDIAQLGLEKFLNALPRSAYWRTAVSEYGVGPPRILPSIITADAPPTTDDELQFWLESKFTPPHETPDFVPLPTPLPEPTKNTIYVVFLPAGVTLTAGGDVSCKTFGGYHEESRNLHLVYALIPRCPTMGAEIDAITPALSHELIEASTDPLPETAPAFNELDPAELVWGFTPGGELGDMCEFVSAAFQRLVGNFVVQRTWSNASAAAGHDPCVPTLPGPYVGAAPALDDVTLDYGNGETTTLGVEVPNGDSVTIDLDLFSDAPAPDWTIGTDDVASVVQHLPAELSFSFDKTTGNAGDVIHLTIKRLKNGDNGGSEFVVTSKVDGEVVGLWWGLATN